MDNSIKSIPAYWEMIVSLHNEGYKDIEYPKEVAERNIEFLNRLKLDNTKTQVIKITSKGYLMACMNDNNELAPFDVIDVEGFTWCELKDFKGDIDIKLK